MLIFQSKANLDEEILCGKITHQLDPEIRKILVCFGTKIPHSILTHDLFPIEIKILSLKMTMKASMRHKSGTINQVFSSVIHM